MNNNGHDNRSGWIEATLQQFEGPLLRYALRLTRNLEVARDVVQETFLKLCHEDPASRQSHLAEWLFTVCRNHAIDRRRKEQRMSTMTEDTLAVLTVPRSQTPDTVETADASRAVLQHLEHLPENQQEVIRLKFQNDLSYREISGITGLSESYVGVLLHMGLKALRERLT